MTSRMSAIATRQVDIAAEGLVQIYPGEDGTDVVALRSVDLSVPAGTRLALLGPSGSGKSTLLSLIAGLLRPTAGQLRVGEFDLTAMTERTLRPYRASVVGTLLQGAARNLLSYTSASRNIAFARLAATRARRRDLPTPAELLEVVGLPDPGHRPVGTLSGGEQQRVALAVSIANLPPVLLADEPTSQLGPEHRPGVVDALLNANLRYGTTLLVVTHDPDVATRLGRTATIRDGRVGALGHDDEDFAVVGKDGSIQLPPSARSRWPAGTLLRMEDDGEQLRLTERDR